MRFRLLFRASCLAVVFGVLPPSAVLAQTPEFTFNSGVTNYSQNFDILGDLIDADWVDADTSGHTLDAWYADRETGTAHIIADNGSNGTAQFFSYGAAANVERALGVMSHDSTTGDQALGVRFENGTGDTIVQIAIAVTYEEWRDGSSETALEMYFRDDNSDDVESFDLRTNLAAWTELDDGSVSFAGGGSGQQDGNLSGNQQMIVFLICVNIENNTDFWIGFRSADGGVDTGSGIGIDDFAVGVVLQGTNPDGNVFIDTFSGYAVDSDITDSGTNSFTMWELAGTASGPNVNDAEAILLDFDGGTDERAARELCPLGYTFDRDNTTTVFATFRFSVTADTAIGTSTEMLLAYLRDEANDENTGSIWLTKAAGGELRFGLGDDAAAADTTLDTLDLAVGSTYTVVLGASFDAPAATTIDLTLTIDPSDASDTTSQIMIADYDPGMAIALDRFILVNDADSGQDGNATVDEVRTGATFLGAAQQSDLVFIEANPDNPTVEQNDTDVPMGGFMVTSSPATPVPTLTDVTLEAAGSGDADAVTAIRLYRDDGDGLFDPAVDTQLDNGAYISGSVTLAIGDTIDADGQMYWVEFDYGDEIVNAALYRYDIDAASIAIGTSDDLPISGSTATGFVPFEVDETGDDNGGTAGWPIAAGLGLVLLMLVATRRRTAGPVME